jgi:hypothetical protein
MYSFLVHWLLLCVAQLSVLLCIGDTLMSDDTQKLHRPLELGVKTDQM